MDPLTSDPMLFRPPRRRRALQVAIGLPLTVVILLPTLFAVWLVWAPHRVELRVSGDELDITTPFEPFSRRRSIDLSTVIAVEEVRLGHGRRTNGTAMPGYCVGRFRYEGLGSVWQATDCSRDVVVLRREGDLPVVLTPPDREAFRRAVDGAGDYRGVQPARGGGRGWTLVKLLVLLTPIAALIVPVVFLVAPSRLAYRVGPGELVVSTLLGSRRYPTHGCSARAHRPRVGMRLWGTGAPGYYTGLYRVDGANARIYTTSLESGVLIEGPGVRVFVNPENEGAFLEAMRTMGGAHAE
jgi:hypothetical protein